MLRYGRLASVLILSLTLLVTACGTPSSAPTPAPAPQGSSQPAPAPAKKIVIGFSNSETGNFATEGSYTRKGYQLWAEQVNAAGGLNVGGTKMQVELRMLDDASDAQTAVKHYERLINQEKVDLLLGPWGSGINFAVSALTDREGWPLLMPSGSADNIFDRGFKTIFQATTRTSQVAQPLIDYIKSNPQIKTIAIVYENFLFCQAIQTTLTNGLKDWNGKIVLNEQYPLAGKDFGTLAAKVKSLNPDAVVQVNIMPSSVYFLRALDELKFRPPLTVLALSNMFKEFHDAMGASADGIVDVGFLAPGYSAEAAKFYKEFQDKYKEVANTDAAHAYLAAQVLGQAVEKAGSIDRKKVMDALHNSPFKTVYGGEIKYDEFGRITNLVPFLTQWQNGERTVVYPKARAQKDLVFPWPPKK